MDPMINTEWMDEAACRYSDEDFFAEVPSDECYALCDVCPVKEPCLRQAMQYEQYGFWAGTLERERLQIRNRNGIPQPYFDRTMTKQLYRERCKQQESTSRVEIAHGTEKGYQLHIKRCIDACEACSAAHSKYIADYRRKKAEEAKARQAA